MKSCSLVATTTGTRKPSRHLLALPDELLEVILANAINSEYIPTKGVDSIQSAKNAVTALRVQLRNLATCRHIRDIALKSYFVHAQLSFVFWEATMVMSARLPEFRIFSENVQKLELKIERIYITPVSWSTD